MQEPNSSLYSMPSLQKVLVIGNGGRENALAWALSQSSGVEEVFVAPGNGGTESHSGCKCIAIEAKDNEGLIKACKSKKINLVIIGPEGPLASGLADAFVRQSAIMSTVTT